MVFKVTVAVCWEMPKIGTQRSVEELQESENCLRNCKQSMVISGKYFKNPMETDQIIFYELAPLSNTL